MIFVDIMDSFSLMKATMNFVENDKEVESFLKSLEFVDNILYTINGVISFAVRDDYVFYMGNNNDDDFKMFSNLLNITSGHLDKIAKEIKSEDYREGNKLLQKPKIVIKGNTYIIDDDKVNELEKATQK